MNRNDMIIDLHGTDFEPEVLAAPNPVLVQFWADWSDLCKATTPTLQAVARDDTVVIKLARVNIDSNRELAEQYGVRAVPTVLFFNRGALRDQIVGRATEQELREKLEQLKSAKAEHER
jgi:thioredoxin